MMQMRMHTSRWSTRFAFSSAVFIAVGASCAIAQTPADRFLAHAATQADIPADAVKLMQETWANCDGCDGDEFLTQALALFSEPFRVGLDHYGAADFEACEKAMSAVSNDADPFVSIHAAAYEIKALVGLERTADALRQIEALLGPENADLERVESHSYFAPEMVFLRGFCLLSDLRHDAAAEMLLFFKDRYPDASQRLIVSAEQMLREIETHQPGRIAEVADLMTFAGRRLNHGDTGEKVRTRQERIIEILDKLIKEAEDQEQSSSSSSSSSGGGGSGSGRSGGNSPNSPMQDSVLPGGSAQEGPLQNRPRANPGEMWGAMPPAERERVLQALRDNFPSRYRQLVEQYYEHLAKKP
jgi:hypothetical protein